MQVASYAIGLYRSDDCSAGEEPDQPDREERHDVQRPPDRVSDTRTFLKPLHDLDRSHVHSLIAPTGITGLVAGSCMPCLPYKQNLNYDLGQGISGWTYVATPLL